MMEIIKALKCYLNCNKWLYAHALGLYTCLKLWKSARSLSLPRTRWQVSVTGPLVLWLKHMVWDTLCCRENKTKCNNQRSCLKVQYLTLKFSVYIMHQSLVTTHPTPWKKQELWLSSITALLKALHSRYKLKFLDHIFVPLLLMQQQSPQSPKEIIVLILSRNVGKIKK